jgi:hypothetical protein
MPRPKPGDYRGKRPFELCPLGQTPDNAVVAIGKGIRWARAAILAGQNGRPGVFKGPAENLFWAVALPFRPRPAPALGQTARGRA